MAPPPNLDSRFRGNEWVAYAGMTHRDMLNYILTYADNHMALVQVLRLL